MSQLLAYLPYQLAVDLLRQPEASPLSYTRRLDAVVLFADVSGFTPMSEALSRYGQAGTEELTALLNDYYEVMIDLVASYGGSIGAFGGDSLTAIFPTAEAPGDASARALRCAIDMQLLMLPYQDISTRAGHFSLAIKVGLAVGPLLCGIVGDTQIRLLSLLAGAALERAANAEHHAHTGEVVVHRDVLALAPTLLVGEERDDYLVVEEYPFQPPYAPLPSLPPAPELLQPTLGAFLHPAIASRLRGDQLGFVNEHRSVSVLFVGFSGFDYDDDPQVAERLRNYVAEVTWIVHRYDGDLNKIDVGDKGSKFLVVFGAPVAHENDAERAMHCALALRELQSRSFSDDASGVRIHIGIASGLVFCGLVGSPMRREYTVMGDTVNLAARLMQAADPETIMVASGSQRRVADQFSWEPLEPLPVKGRSRPVTVYRLKQARERLNRHQEPAYKLPMVGREEEIRAIEGYLDTVASGCGQVLGISAEAGMGKSRLVAEVIRIATRRGMHVLNGECLSHGGSISYLPWHGLLRGLFGIDPSWSEEIQLRHLRTQIAAINPALLARLPVLGMALNLPIEETDLTRSLDARLRKEALESTVLECVRAITGGQISAQIQSVEPTLLIVIEDCHWIDPLSQDLLEVVARGIIDRPVLVMLAYRPPEHEYSRLRVGRLAHFTELHLREFTLRETEWLIGLKFGYLFGARGVLPPSFVERITDRSQGNPFYIDQMINYIQDQGISPSDTAALERVRLPDSLRSLIISRIDRLSEEEQVTLKVASVIGRVFRASWLWGIYPQLGKPEEVRGYLDTLSRLELTPMEKAEPELEYLFKHIVTQEVAYESLAYATRTMLHAQVGEFIERQFAGELDRYLDMLAYHYGRSEDLEKKRHYFRLAGEEAQAAYANEVAIDYFQRLLPLLSGRERIAIQLRLGEVLQLVGRRVECEAEIRAAIDLAENDGDPATIARCRTALANMLASRGDYDSAITIIDAVMPIWERLDDPSGYYDALWVLGYVLIDIGEYTRGLRQLEHTHEIAVRLNNEALIAKSIGYMGLVYVDIYDYEMALYCLERSAQMAARFSDWGLLAQTRGSIGFIYMNLHRLAAARDIFHELLQRAVEIGDRRFAARYTREIGRCYQLMGDTTSALYCYASQLAVGLELGEKRALCIGLGYLADAYLQIGDLARAERVIELAIAMCDSIKLVYWACEFRHSFARLRFAQGRFAEAAALNTAALELARQLGSHKRVQLEAHLLAARLRVIKGEQPAASAIAGLHALDEDWYSEREQADLLYTIWRIEPGSEANRLAAAAAYQTLMQSKPSIEAQTRLAEISGGPAPELPALPELSALIAGWQTDLETLIDQAEQLVTQTAT